MSLLLALLWGTPNVPAPQEPEFEEPSALVAAEVLPPHLLSGEHHRVRSEVGSDGYMNTYLIQSDFGEFEVQGTTQLAKRVREIAALAQLSELSKTEVFARAAIEAGLSPVNAIVDFSTNPVKTIKGIPGGIGRMFKRYLRKTKEGVADAREFVASDDAEQGAEEGIDHDDATEETEETSKSKELAEGYFGVGGAERAWHQQFGTDPYTTNQALKAAIKSVAWADRLGRFSLSIVSVPSVPGADVIGDANDLVWSKDPYELEDYNRGVLASAGADEALMEAFFANTSLTPTLQTTLIAAFASLDGVAGLDQVLKRILDIDSPLEARIVRDSILLLVAYHESERPLDRIVPITPLPSAVDVDGVGVVPVGVDYLIWTPEVAAAADRYVQSLSEAGASKAQYWSGGKVSVRARDELEARGWTVHSADAMTGARL